VQGFHVYKVMEHLPAQRSERIQVGDQLLEVRECVCVDSML